jgi:hypothetical protein
MRCRWSTRAEEEVRVAFRSGESQLFGTGECPLMQMLVRLDLTDRALQFCFVAKYDMNITSPF